MVKIGVLVSGSGSNLQAIIDAAAAGRINGEIVVVVSNEPEAYGLIRASEHGIDSVTVNHRDFSERRDFDRQLVKVLEQYNVELVVLAGFMRVVSKTFLERFPDRVTVSYTHLTLPTN